MKKFYRIPQLSKLIISFHITSFSRLVNFVKDMSLYSFIIIQGAFPFKRLKGFNTYFTILSL